MSRLKEVTTKMDQEEADKSLQRVYRLSKRSCQTVFWLALLLPVGTYLYTRRWIALVPFLLGAFVATAVFPNPDEDSWIPSPPTIVILTTWAIVDNHRAIMGARRAIEGMENEQKHLSLGSDGE